MNPPATAAVGVIGTDGAGVVNGARWTGCDAVAKLDDRATVCKLGLLVCAGGVVVGALAIAVGAVSVAIGASASGNDSLPGALSVVAAGVPGVTGATCTMEDVADDPGVDWAG
jgi:hypothetical protein